MAIIDVSDYENTNVHTTMLFVVLGILAFFLVSSVFFFKNKLFQDIFLKPSSFAAEEKLIPQVDLEVEYKGKIYDGVTNIPNDGSQVKLIWSTSNSPTKCTGRSWGISSQDQSWDGTKETHGGKFTSISLDKNNSYVYSIDCSNEYGDAEGDSVAINVGAVTLDLKPAITFLNEEGMSPKRDLSLPIILEDRSQLKVAWSGINLHTPYSICVTNGSWPINYQNISRDFYTEDLIVKEKGIYKFTLFCSNESSFTKGSLNIVNN